MRRREFVQLAAGTAMTWPLALRAQQKAMPVIGWLSTGSPGPWESRLTAFHQGLGETGYVAGQNVMIEYRYAEESQDRLAGFAADLVSRKVDLIAAPGAARAAKTTLAHRSSSGRTSFAFAAGRLIFTRLTPRSPYRFNRSGSSGAPPNRGS